MRPWTLSALVTTAGLAALVSAPTLGAQEVVLDEGEFTLWMDGTEVGTETFNIRRVGAPEEAKIWATATVEQDEGSAVVSMRPVLQTTVDRMPIVYQNKVSGGEESEVRIGMADRRFVATIVSARGERGRELRATPGAVFLEGTVAHQYYFLPDAPAAGQSVEVPVIVPRTGEQVRGTLTRVGTETLRIAGRAVEATRVRLTVDGEERDVWRDADGRVLKLEIPGRSFRAERGQI